MIYDVPGESDPYSDNISWPSGQLPEWKDKLFDFQVNQPNSEGLITDFFKKASLGTFNVLGERVINNTNPNKPIQISKALIDNSPSFDNALFSILNSNSSFLTNQGNAISSFDLWTKTADYEVKSQVPNQKIDHLMIICRNHPELPSNNGYAEYLISNSLSLFTYNLDTYSEFCANGTIPLKILTHEFSHCLFGDNAFHAGGGNSDYFSNFFNLQGGWSTMGGANTSLMTFNGWDRFRLGWKPSANSDFIMAHDQNNDQYINSDIDPSTSVNSEHNYVLRDFATNGDVVRIKLPNLPNTESQQWIWIENHKLKSSNNFELDRFFYDYAACIEPANSGLYMFYQIDRNSVNSLAGKADYIKSIDAEGFYDLSFSQNELVNNCVNSTYNFAYKKILPNPFSGFKETEEMRTYDVITGLTKGVLPIIEELNNGNYEMHLQLQGDSKDAFRINYKSKIGIGSNPALVNTMTDACNLGNEMYLDNMTNKPKSPNNRVIYLNGLSIEITEQLTNGDIKLKIELDDVEVNNDTRWAADNIVLNAIPSSSGNSLILKPGITVSIDRSLSVNRLLSPENFRHDPNEPEKPLFNSPTVLTVKPTAKIEMQAASNLVIENGSTLKLNNTAEINVLPNAHIEVKSNGILDLEAGSLVKLAENATILVHDGGKIIIRDGAVLQLQKNSQLLIEQDGVWGQGELVIENSQTDFGLILGDVNDGANTTECLINGKLTLGTGVDFTYKGSGFYTFGEYFNVNFEDPASKVNLVGLSQNNLLINIECAEIDFRNHDVNIDKGLISYQNTGLTQITQ